MTYFYLTSLQVKYPAKKLNIKKLCLGFGAQTATPQLFGQTQPQPSTGLFGATTTNSFGQKPNTFSSFGQTGAGSSLFGQPQPTQTQNTATPLFGQTSTTNSGGLFGSTSAFGSPQTAQTGTVVKFTPVSGTDTMIKNRVTHSISTRHHCITFMKEYESKSLEELRYEDYLSGRKGNPQQPPPASNLFGQMGTTTVGNTSNLFGATPSTQSFGQTSSVFGQPQPSTSLFTQKSAFGAAPTTSSPFSFNSAPNQTPFGASAVKPFGATPSSTGYYFLCKILFQTCALKLFLIKKLP